MRLVRGEGCAKEALAFRPPKVGFRVLGSGFRALGFRGGGGIFKALQRAQSVLSLWVLGLRC